MKITPPRFRAWRKSFLIRATPRPMRNPVTSLPLMTKKGTPASPATARAISVLPVPGGPNIRTPLGVRAPDRLEGLGRLEELDQLAQLGDGALVAAHIAEGGAAPPGRADADPSPNRRRAGAAARTRSGPAPPATSRTSRQNSALSSLGGCRVTGVPARSARSSTGVTSKVG